MIKILVNGANGRMGITTVATIQKSLDFQLVETCVRGDDLAQKIQQSIPDIVIDFTNPDIVFDNAKTIINANVHPVIGTTGLSAEQIQILYNLCQEKSLGGIIAPNFSMGALLSMHFSSIAARYFKHAEIVEAHHPKKKDAPSGTAIKTAALIAEIRKQDIIEGAHQKAEARGFLVGGVPIHSIRLPGLSTQQTVYFGGDGENLSIQHQVFDNQSYMSGVLLACEKVMQLSGLVYGLDNLLDFSGK